MEGVIVGNGSSRSNLSLEDIRKEFGPIFGCNALYREWWPDFLVSIDPGIINEILTSKFPKDRIIIPEYDQQFEPAEFNPARPRENSGMVAMKEAIKRGYKTLYCFGFDFLLDNDEAKQSNVFEGSKHYGLETKASLHDIGNRVKYFQWFALKNSDVEFVFLYPKEYDNYSFTHVGSNVKYGVLDE